MKFDLDIPAHIYVLITTIMQGISARPDFHVKSGKEETTLTVHWNHKNTAAARKKKRKEENVPGQGYPAGTISPTVPTPDDTAAGKEVRETGVITPDNPLLPPATTAKKKKSPSRYRRDLQRYQAWKARCNLRNTSPGNHHSSPQRAGPGLPGALSPLQPTKEGETDPRPPQATMEIDPSSPGPTTSPPEQEKEETTNGGIHSDTANNTTHTQVPNYACTDSQTLKAAKLESQGISAQSPARPLIPEIQSRLSKNQMDTISEQGPVLPQIASTIPAEPPKADSKTTIASTLPADPPQADFKPTSEQNEIEPLSPILDTSFSLITTHPPISPITDKTQDPPTDNAPPADDTTRDIYNMDTILDMDTNASDNDTENTHRDKHQLHEDEYYITYVTSLHSDEIDQHIYYSENHTTQHYLHAVANFEDETASFRCKLIPHDEFAIIRSDLTNNGLFPRTPNKEPPEHLQFCRLKYKELLHEKAKKTQKQQNKQRNRSQKKASRRK